MTDDTQNLKIAMIAADWGSTNLRALALDVDGNLLDKISSENGMLNLRQSDYEPTLKLQLANWRLSKKLPIVLSGMVGSQHGWQEVDYLSCPTGLDDLSQNIHRIATKSMNVNIVAGIKCKSEFGQNDVARGEEAQVFGAMQILKQDRPEFLALNPIYCLPGTHSKWMEIKQQKIEFFSTYMSGEFYNILMKHSILAHLNQQNSDIEGCHNAFEKGVLHANKPGGLTHQLFSARSDVLMGELQPRQVSDYVSGLIIGNEISNFVKSSGRPICLVGASNMNILYSRALRIHNIQHELINVEYAAYLGIYTIAKQAGLLISNSGLNK